NLLTFQRANVPTCQRTCVRMNKLRVVAFESRLVEQMSSLIARHGGEPLSAPALREVALEENAAALEFARRLFNGEVDAVIFLTGVGTRALTRVIETRYTREQWTHALRQITTIARGPKPVAALRELGLTPTFTVPEPNTWREILAAVDSDLPLSGKRVAVQEYGTSNPHLLDGLRQRGAEVLAVPVYQWALPEDLEPLRHAMQKMIAGEVDVALFTSAQQVRHLLQVAAQEGLEASLRDAFRRIVIGSIGPTCTEAIQEVGLTVDYEPDRPKMADLVREVMRRAAYLLDKKRTAHAHGVDTLQWKRVDMVWQCAHLPPCPRANVDASAFLRACRRQPTDYTPIWLMRQAGRYLREYREIRSKVSFLQMCKTPELAAEVTLMAAERLGVDAAILFADILLVLEPMGVGLKFSKGEGPVIERPVRTAADVDALREVEAEELGYVFDAVRLARRALRPDIPLIGFAGAPFTVASYAIEGGGSRHYEHTKRMMFSDAGAWHALMERLTRALTDYLNRQIAAGADAVQLFDSWVGCLSPDDYCEFVQPHVRRLINGLTPGVPVIHFATGNPALLTLMRDAGGDVIGLDWRVDLAEAWARLGEGVAVQGNLDPLVLLASPTEIRRRARRLLEKAAGRRGYIFNLGHGVLPNTPVDHVLALVDAVHELSGTLH
ncbi:MAG: uroporphyrinogen decarboxylase, partial [Abditibacteriales bacterium]|nr:uroporphyrinogen decarboxylase [Abditibacteriales bacterium]MDW8366843.1 uroporphyrinogen decarboxylase [Abditibacteriales bacterium]